MRQGFGQEVLLSANSSSFNSQLRDYYRSGFTSR